MPHGLTRAMVRTPDLGQMGRGVDSEILISRSGERGERGRHLSSPPFVLAARAMLLAGFENPSPENAGKPIFVRLGRAGNRMRE
jgi:hypothetical protein